MMRITINVVLFSLVLSLAGCSNHIPRNTSDAGKATIYPDYCNVTLPVNIAPLNFRIEEKAERYKVVIQGKDKKSSILVKSSDGTIAIPNSKWKRLLAMYHGSEIYIDIYGRKDGIWKRFDPIVNYVANETIDGYLAYRLIEPGFETWNKMGLYQRNLGNFEEKPIIINELTDGNCMNCHTFCRNSSKTMLFHVRAKYGGTIIVRNGNLTKVNTKTDSTISAGVYPSWHPDGRYVAFSVNHIIQSFHAIPERKVEVIDTLSDIIVYDAEKNRVIQCSSISSPNYYETFPAWSPDGRYLYYCSASLHPYHDYQNIRYDLLRIVFNADNETFGSIDTVISASKNGYSVSFPRISPDGNYLMYCHTRYGNFTIWHNDSDLELLNLKDSSVISPAINSNRSESYHSWSSNGRWIVFSSRRADGLYTRLYLAYFDPSGKFHKPFLLPQKNPEYNLVLDKSYNVPELINAEITIDPRDFASVIRSQAQSVTFSKALSP